MKEATIKEKLPDFRNLRDVSQYSLPRIKSNMLFRSSDLSAYETDPSLKKWLDREGIKTMIDLRNKRDIQRRTYSKEILRGINYINLVLVSEETETRIIGRDNTEYYSWVLNNESKNLKLLFAILSEKKNFPLVIHCHVGMDRTGIVLALIHLLLDSSIEKITTDYLASGLNMKRKLIELILQNVEDQGGIREYLNKNGISYNIQNRIVGNLTK